MTVVDPRLVQAMRSGSFAQTLRVALAVSGRTLEQVRDELAERDVRVSAVTLSYWVRGRTQPERPSSLRAVPVLEDILDLPPGALSTVLPAPRPRGPRTHISVGADHQALWRPADRVMRLLTAINAPDPERLCVVSAHDRHVIGADRSCLRMTLGLVVRAQTNGVDRILMLVEHAGPTTPTSINVTRGGVLGRVRTDTSEPTVMILAAEILLDQVLERGETATTECEFRFPPSDCPEYGANRRFPQPGRQYLLEVDFDPAARPARCLRISQTSVQATPIDVDEVRMGRSATAHTVLHDLPAGIHGLRWEWD